MLLVLKMANSGRKFRVLVPENHLRGLNNKCLKTDDGPRSTIWDHNRTPIRKPKSRFQVFFAGRFRSFDFYITFSFLQWGELSEVRSNIFEKFRITK